MFNLDERPDLKPQVNRLNEDVWPEFMLHDAVAERCWPHLGTDFATFQIVVCEGRNRVVAAGNSIPVVWDGTREGLPAGWDAALEQGVRNLGQGSGANALSALAALVGREHRGRDLGGTLIRAMKTVAAERGLNALIAPVRPSLKERYPLTPMERYVLWKREDGLSFDPWMRLHLRLGAEILCVAPRSMMITGTTSEWEDWTGMRFPESGSYVVPGALSPVLIDVEADSGIYEEPNVWMRHAVGDPLTSSGAG